MNKAFYRIFLFCMVGMLFSNTLIKVTLFVNYQLNQAEITRKFCENKAKPKLQCNGKCHLAKQLAKQEKQDKSSSETSKFKLEITEITAQINTPIAFAYPIVETEKMPIYGYSETRSDSYLDQTFHPPTCQA